MEEQTFELLEKLYVMVVGIDKKVDQLSAKVDRLEIRMDSLEVRMDSLEARMDSLEEKMYKLETRMDKLKLNQEKMQRDIQLIAEVQASHMAQNEREHATVLELANQKSDLVETALRHLAGESVMHKAELAQLRRMVG